MLALVLPAGLEAQSRIAFKDLKGRSVTLPAPAKRLLIDDGRYLIALSLIHPDPISVVAAWPKDINRIGDQTYERYHQKFPRIADVAQVSSSAGTFSLERVLAVRPDVAVFTLGLGPSDEEVRQICLMDDTERGDNDGGDDHDKADNGGKGEPWDCFQVKLFRTTLLVRKSITEAEPVRVLLV